MNPTALFLEKNSAIILFQKYRHDLSLLDDAISSFNNSIFEAETKRSFIIQYLDSYEDSDQYEDCDTDEDFNELADEEIGYQPIYNYSKLWIRIES